MRWTVLVGILAGLGLCAGLAGGGARTESSSSAEGLVLDVGAGPSGMKGAQVTLKGKGIDKRTTTDGDGRFLFKDLPAGTYELAAAKKGYRPWRHKISLPKGFRLRSPWTDLPLAPSKMGVGTLRGRVLDAATGQPMPDVIVATTGPVYVTTTDAAGRFRFDYLPTDQYEYGVNFIAPGCERRCRKLLIRAGQDHKLDDVRLPKAAPRKTVFFREGFEGGLGAWRDLERPKFMYVTDRQAHTGRKCLEMKFVGGMDEAGPGWMWRWIHEKESRAETPLEYDGTETLYLRFHQKWSKNFRFHGHDVYALSGSGGAAGCDSALYWEVGDEPAPPHPLAMVRTPREVGDDYVSYRARKLHIKPGRWYRVEVLARMNTAYTPSGGPAKADGALRVWIDNQLVVDAKNVLMRNAYVNSSGCTSSYSRLMIGPYYHDGVPGKPSFQMFSWIDDLMVANYRAGP